MSDLHPTIAELLAEEAAADRPPIHALSIDAARQRLREDATGGDAEAPAVAKTADLTVPGPDGNGLDIRVYWPTEDERFDANDHFDAGNRLDADDRFDESDRLGGDQRDRDGALPVLVWYHGGGFALGDLEATDSIARVLASEVGSLVVTVDYRLAPEHPFPAGVKDCYGTLEWVAEHADSIGGDPERIAVGGGSAGGGLTAAVALLARDRDGPSIARQVLVCPVTTDDGSLPAREENAEGYGLTAAEMEWYHGMYTPDPIAAANPCAYPLKARDLSDLPPATVLTAGFDPLRDDGKRFADRLEDAGVPVTYRNFPTVTHSFFGLLVEPSIDPAWEAVGIATSDLQRAFD